MPAFMFLLLPLALAIGAFGQSGPTASSLDTVLIHQVYLEGEFDLAIRLLEPALKRKNLTHGDSVFIFKHLGVIHAANENTREKGKYYMYQLIQTEPLTNILDMYASDMIYMIFKNMKEEYEASLNRLERNRKWIGKDGKEEKEGKGQAPFAKDTALALHGTPRPEGKDPAGKVPAGKKTSKGHPAYYWLGGVGVAAAVGVGMFVYLHEDPEAPVTKKIYGLE